MTDHDSDPLLDARLRETPLPEGLASRLRCIAAPVGEWSDRQFDLELARVEVPPGLVSRIRQIASDEPLDEALVEVEVPEGLLARCRQLLCDVQLDEAVRDVVVPASLLPSLVHIPRREMAVSTRPGPSRFLRRLANLALAAALVVLIGGGYAAIVAGMLSPLRLRSSEPFTLAVEYPGPLEITWPPESPSLDAVAIGLSESGSSGADETSEFGAKGEQFVSLTIPPSPPVPGPAGSLLAQLNAGMRPWEDMLLLRYGLLGQQLSSDRPAELVVVTPAKARGLEPPAVRAFDRKFLLKYGVQPVVSPAAHEALITSRVPLSTSTVDFELAKRRLAEGRWPAAAEVRVEDFLAAIDYRFPAPPLGQLGLTMSGGPSIFGQPAPGIPQASLLQVGVQAGSIPFRRLPATHLVVSLDGSSAMQRDGQFQAARRAIAWLAGQLNDHDRLSLLISYDDDVTTIEAVGRASLGELLFALERFEPRGRPNLAAGVQAALSLSLRNELDERLVQRVALVTAAGASLPDAALPPLRDLAAEAAEREVGIVLLEAGRTTSGDSNVASLVSAAEGQWRSAAAADELRFSLAESLTGVSSIVAADAALRITFNPRTVAGYRLLGHEANALASVAPVAIEVDLRGGETATALYEIWLSPGSEDEVAQAEVTWRDPRTGEKQVARQSIGRQQFAGTFSSSSPALQQAALAAETAEVLRESYFVQARPRSLQHVVEASKTVAYELSRQADFRRFAAFLKELDKARRP